MSRARSSVKAKAMQGGAVALVGLVLLVVGWVVIVIDTFGSGLNLSIGNLDSLLTGVVFVLAGLTLRQFDGA